MVNKACKFFALGTCTRGQACTYSHEVASSSDPRSTVVIGVPCRFHLLGRCNKGAECRYEHLKNEDIPTSNHNVPSEQSHAGDPKVENHPLAASEHSMSGMEVRNLGGASVTFGLGAQVHDLELSSDYSAVQMTYMHLVWDAQFFQKFMASLGETVPLSCIHVKTVAESLFTVATAKVRDAGFAQRLKSKVDSGREATNLPDIAVTVVQAGMSSESSMTRLQMSTVSCAWYKPSRTAWLHYNNTGKARAAERFIASRDYRIAGRPIQATLQVPEHRFGRHKPTITSVQLANLDAFTTVASIQRHIPDHLTPTDVIIGKPSYSTSMPEVEDYVKALLEGVGPLESWESSSTTSITHVKAIARFGTGEDARKAVNQLNGKKIPLLANSNIFVSPLISVKFNVPKAMYRAIRGDLNSLRAQAWYAGSVHTKAYPPIDPTQKLVGIRLYGEDAKAVSKAKSALEEILTGDVAMNGDLEIWDEFFANSRGLTYLNELSYTHQGYVYRDMRKQRLSIHGSPESKHRIRKALSEKLASLMETTHYISLNAEGLKKALHGGFRRIVAALGKHKASLDVRQRPQIITIKGSARDLETARALLDQDVASELENLTLGGESPVRPDCAVCWTEAENIYRTPCGHFYCASCFASQCHSAGEGNDLPVRCLGDSATCLRAFTIQDLKTALPPPAFEQLLQASFTAHVRTNPNHFQYCLTPDCQQIYRVSPHPTLTDDNNDNDGIIFTCPSCLTPICTACHTTSHDGLSCALYRRLVAQGTEEFAKWKRENNVKDCPVCKVPIEKIEGCNHVECRNCGVHICWVCLETFEGGAGAGAGAGECYGHLRVVHGGFFDEEEEG